jgi:hypothetical protein
MLKKVYKEEKSLKLFKVFFHEFNLKIRGKMSVFLTEIFF